MEQVGTTCAVAQWARMSEHDKLVYGISVRRRFRLEVDCAMKSRTAAVWVDGLKAVVESLVDENSDFGDEVRECVFGV